MQPVLSAEQIRDIDRLTVENYHVPSLLLMEAAGGACLDAIQSRLDNDLTGKKALILCGRGNNGGDGAALARGLTRTGMHCTVVETACSMGAAIAAAPRGQSVVGVENHTSFIHAVREGRVTVTAHPLTRGRRSQLWQADARSADGTLVASGRVRLLALDAGAALAGEPVGVKR